MRRSWAAASVGILVIIMALITYKVVKLTADNASASAGYTVFGRFKDAAGLYSKSRVQTAGIPVGQIEERSLDPDRPVARVVIRLNQGIKVYSNAIVQKKAASLLGEFYLEIDPGSPKSFVNEQPQTNALLKEGDEIKVVIEPTAMNDIVNDVGTVVPILRDILTDVRRLTSGPVSNIAENVNRMIETNSVVLERLMVRVDHIAANVESVTDREKDDLAASIKNVREITESIKTFVGTTQGEVTQTGTTMRDSLTKVQGTLVSLDQTIKNLEKVTDRVEKGEGTVGRILTDDTIARNVEDITEDASTLVHGVSQLQTIVGLRSEFNVLSGQFKNYLSIQLQPRPDKFYLIELVDDPKGYRENTVTYTKTTLDPVPVRNETTKYTDSRLKFSFQLGKTYGALTGRFGIKESTGGFGADLKLFNGLLVLSTDVFDFKYNKWPRVQTRLAAHLWRNSVYAVAGLDDVINQRAKGGAGGGFDGFLGLQLLFNDQDLKTFLLFGGGAAASASR